MSGFKSSARHTRSKDTAAPSEQVFYEEEGLDEEDVGEEGDYDVDYDDYERSLQGEDGQIGQGGGGNTKQKKDGAQVLPVADLPDDWEGEVLDGATYLAVSA